MINCDHQYGSRHDEPKKEQFLEKKVIELRDRWDVNELLVSTSKSYRLKDEANNAYDPLTTIHVASFF